MQHSIMSWGPLRVLASTEVQDHAGCNADSLCGHKTKSPYLAPTGFWARSRYCQAKTKFLCRSPRHGIKVEGSPQTPALVCLYWALETFFLDIRSTDFFFVPCSVRSSSYPKPTLPVCSQPLFLEEVLPRPGEELSGCEFTFHIFQSLSP